MNITFMYNFHSKVNTINNISQRSGLGCEFTLSHVSAGIVFAVLPSMDVAHFYLDGNTDAVEFCPHYSYNHVLAAATYTLQEGDNPSRSGSVVLFNVNAGSGQLDLLHCLESTGIFDIKWSPVEANIGRPLLAQADSDGYVKVHGLESSLDGLEEKGLVLREGTNEKISSSMCLCLDWNPSATSIAVGLSDGSVSLLSRSETKLEIEQEWKAHDFEICWDVRDCPSKLVFRNSKEHRMGVCCITKSISDPNVVLTGSYDEHIRVWDIRSISKPVNQSSVCLGGGVWRIKQHPHVPGLVLAACMHNGFALVDLRGEEIKIVETYNRHSSLAYGVDWQKGGSIEGRRENMVIATCSFYDRLLRIWTPQCNIFA
ncbi:WD_REPEATS_REGION domain-containing protein [Psidium guajava]|nr:WD_REPEATS_REGION domain-containing protein [Psidium guajava]